MKAIAGSLGPAVAALLCMPILAYAQPHANAQAKVGDRFGNRACT